MAPRRNAHPIARYMRMHDWEWIPEEQITHTTGCTPNDLQALATSKEYKQLIEYRDGKYRYIGNLSSERRKCVELLKAVYPEALPGGEIQKRAGLGKNAGWVMTRHISLLPVEVMVERQRYKGDVKMYRYIPNDERSLLNHEPTVSAKQLRVCKSKEDALKVLRNCPGVWFSASEIAICMGRKTGSEISQTLRYLTYAHPEIRVKPGYTKYYCYSEKPMEVEA